MLPPLRERMNQYRALVRALLPPDNPLLQSLPALTPPSGSTPGAVDLSGAWDAAQGRAAFAWTPSASPDLDHYSLRAVPGADAGCKLYVVTRTGNEKGSNAVRVAHPA